MSDSEVSKPEQPPLSFYVLRHRDKDGGRTGYVAQGTQWSDGECVVRWPGKTPCTQVWASVAHFIEVHGHEGETTIEWISVEPGVEWQDPLARQAECTA